jgi:hypothetical protein
MKMVNIKPHGQVKCCPGTQQFCPCVGARATAESPPVMRVFCQSNQAPCTTQSSAVLGSTIEPPRRIFSAMVGFIKFFVFSLCKDRLLSKSCVGQELYKLLNDRWRNIIKDQVVPRHPNMPDNHRGQKFVERSLEVQWQNNLRWMSHSRQR